MFEWRLARTARVLEVLEQRRAETGPYERGCNLDRFCARINQLMNEGFEVFPVPIYDDIDLREFALLLAGEDESERNRKRKCNKKIESLTEAIRGFGREASRKR